MDLLSPQEMLRIALAVMADIPHGDTGGIATLPVRLKNDSSITLTSEGDHPVHLAYHWRDRDGALVEWDCARTRLPHRIAPATALDVAVNIAFPAVPGEFVIEVTLVQEGIEWFDLVWPADPLRLRTTLVQDEPWWHEQDSQLPVFEAQAAINTQSFRQYLTAPDGRSRPAGIKCETVNICSNDCVICPYSSQKRARHAMPMPIWRKVLSDYSEMGGGEISLTPVVGDIFLDRLLPERLALLPEYPLVAAPMLTTNALKASLFNDADLALIVRTFRAIYVSVYGLDRHSYAAMSRVDAYDEMVDSINRIVALARGSQVLLAFRLTEPVSARELEAWMDRVVHAGRSGGAEVLLGSGSVTEFRGWSHFDESSTLPGSAAWVLPGGVQEQCLVALGSLGILSNGDVSICPAVDFDRSDDLHLGNIADSSLLDLYNSSVARRHWDWATFGVPNYCQRCACHQPVEMLRRRPAVLTAPFDELGP